MLQSKHFQNPTSSSYLDSTHEYQDVSVFNNSTGSATPIPLVYNQTKLTNVIDKSNDYYVSIVRWSADSILPQIIPEMYTNVVDSGTPGNVYVGLTTYEIGIVETEPGSTKVSMSSVIYNPDSNLTNGYNQPPLNPKSQNEYYNDPYYWIGDIREFLDMLNKSLLQAGTIVSALSGTGETITGLGTPLTAAQVPRFSYNTTAGKIELLCPAAEFTPSTGKYYTVVMNEQLHNLMNTFYTIESKGTYYSLFTTYPTKIIGNDIVDPNLNLFLVQVPNDFGRSAFAANPGAAVPSTSFEVLVCSQTNSSIPSMSPVNSVVFQTTSIPVNNTLTGSPAFLGPNIQGNNALQNNAGVLTDFQVPLVSGTEYSGSMLFYQASSEYRLLDLISNSPTQVLNIVVYWLDKIGNYHEFLVKNQGSANLKLMFRKKTFNGID